MNNIEKGRYGEKLARSYLVKEGYYIKDFNFRCKIGEVDIICEDKLEDLLIFIEVKLRTNERFGYPREAVDKRKQNKIKKVALYYVKRYEMYNFNIRFDVIEINYMRKEINHIKYAF